MMKIEKLDDCPKKNPNNMVKLTEMGNITEIQYMSRRNNKATIRMLPGGNEYVELSTGEIKEVIHHETRADQKKSLYRTFRNVRATINSNVTDVSNVRWITLTYAENMTDTKRLKDDFNKFDKRFQYYCKKNSLGKAEYIAMMEPQARGAWHIHMLYIWPNKAPFIPNDDLSDIWGFGFVKVKKLDNVDNVGAYLTAYLGDMEIDEMIDNDMNNDIRGTCKVLESVDSDGNRSKKAFIKGARLSLYPVGFNMIRCSRGVKRATEEMCTQVDAQKKVLGATKTYEKTIRLVDTDNDFESIINTIHYNKIRNNNQ